MKIAAYCRVSTEKEEQLDSLNHQKEFFLTYAQRNGHELYRLYADEGISGTSVKRREAFQQLMRDAETGAFQMVVVKDISRFARNTVDALQSIRTLKALGIRTLFLTANMDSMGDSEFVLTLFSAMAQEESNNLSKRVKWGKRINAEKGRVPRGLFGYDRIDNFTLEINPIEADVVRRIFSLYTRQGPGCRCISQILNQNGDKTKFGGDWDARGVRRVLMNPIYCGILVNHKYEVQDFLTGKQIALPEEDHFCHNRPEWAIVTTDTFQKAQQIRLERRIPDTLPGKTERYSGKHLFSTLIRCAHCGRSFCRKTYTYVNTRVYWHCVTNDQQGIQGCENRVSLDEAELMEALSRFILSQIGDPEAFTSRVLAQLSSRTVPAKNHCIGQELKQEKLLAKMERYQELYANGLITLEALKAKLLPIQKELNRISQECEPPPPTLTFQEGLEASQGLREEIHRFLHLQSFTNKDLREILDHISVSKDAEVKIVLKKLPPA